MSTNALAERQDLASPKLPTYPKSWYFICTSKNLKISASKPHRFSLGSREFIAFRVSNNTVSVLDGRCCHFGAKLGAGRVLDDCIECPLHGWRFDSKGTCTRIPAGGPKPEWAKIKSYPVTERFGLVYFFLGESPLFELPTFPEVREEDLRPTPPLIFDASCPWFMIGANGCDTQHYRMAHDRSLFGNPTTSRVGDFGFNITLQLEVLRTSLVDRIMAICVGSRVNFSVTNYGGNLILVTSRLKRSLTRGVLNVVPTGPNTCRIINTVLIERSSGFLARILIDPINGMIRRAFIQRFLRSDQPRIDGSYASLARCTEADTELKEFLVWVCSLNNNEVIPTLEKKAI